MDRDDVQVGRVLTRREALALIGASGAGLLTVGRSRGWSRAAAFQLPACVVRPEQTLGPYFVEEQRPRLI